MLSGAKGQTVKLLTPSKCRAPQTQRHSCLSGDYQSQLICDLEQIFDYSDALLICFHIYFFFKSNRSTVYVCKL